MKRTIAIIACMIFSYFSGFSQNVSEFGTIGTEWWIEGFLYVNDENSPPAYLTSIVRKHSSEQEVMYKGKLSKKIIEREFHRVNMSLNYSEVPPTSLPIYVYTENDTVFYYHNFFEKYVPLYIFNVAVEDTLEFYVPEVLINQWVNQWPNPWPNQWADTTFKVIVDSIFYYEVDGKPLKTIVLRDPNEGPTSIAIGFGGIDALGIYSSAGLYMERIGAPKGEFISPRFVGEFPTSGNLPEVLCYSDNEISHSFHGKMELINSKCAIVQVPNAINDLKYLAQQIDIYPNPASEKLTISGLEQVSVPLNLYIYDLTGKQIRAVLSLNSKKIEIDVSNLASGLYFLKMVVGQEYIYKKFSVL